MVYVLTAFPGNLLVRKALPVHPILMKKGPAVADPSALIADTAYGHFAGRQLSDWPSASASTSDSSIDAMIFGVTYMSAVLQMPLI